MISSFYVILRWQPRVSMPWMYNTWAANICIPLLRSPFVIWIFSALHTGASKVTLMTVPDPKMEMRSWRADFLCVSLSDIVSNLSGRTLDNRLMTSTGKHAYLIRTGRGAGEGATVRNRASNSVEFADPLL